jgi:hypothetical protein
MTAEKFRALALELPQSVEGAHMGHADFRVGGKIFATLGPDEKWGMVKLTIEQQSAFARAQPDVFEPFDNAWGRRGATKVHLKPARVAIVREALSEAWRNTAPPRVSR